MRVLSAWLSLGLLASVPSVASADIIADEEAGCRTKNEGDPCSIRDEAGTCAKSTCTRNDYSDGVPPKTKQVECLVCEAGEPTPEEPTPEEPTPEEPAPEEPAPEQADDAKAAAPQKEAEAKPTKASGCSTGGSAPLGVLLLVGLGAVRRRR